MGDSILMLLLALIILLYVLISSAKEVEKRFVKISKKLRISEFFVGFVILGFITTLPELSIAAISSKINPELSIGNLVGATIVLLGLVIGIAIFRFGKFNFRGRFAEKETFFSLGQMLLAMVFMYDAYLSEAEGVALVACYIGYVIYLGSKFKVSSMYEHLKANHVKIKDVLISFFCAIILVISSYFIVQTSIKLAELINIPAVLIGLFMLAIGTNLPEITVLLTTSKERMGETRLAIGNFLGSASVNPGVIGLLTILAGGIKLNSFLAILPGIIILTFTILLFAFFSWSGRVMTKTEGGLLVLVYICWIFIEVVLAIS